MHALMRRMKAAYLAHYVGHTRPVLWEDTVSEDVAAGTRTWSGLTDNYLRVHAVVPAEVDLRNAITPTRLVQVLDGERLLGEPDLARASWPRRPLGVLPARMGARARSAIPLIPQSR